MPELTPARRGSGAQIPRVDDRPPLPVPDQSRYGAATTDPLGREGPGWRLGDDRLPKLRDGWHYDPRTRKTTKKPKKESTR